MKKRTSTIKSFVRNAVVGVVMSGSLLGVDGAHSVQPYAF